jgi:WD40 repeat protein
MAAAPDRKSLAVGTRDGMLHCWDQATGAQKWKVQAHQAEIGAIAFSQDGGRVASAGADGVICSEM